VCQNRTRTAVLIRQRVARYISARRHIDAEPGAARLVTYGLSRLSSATAAAYSTEFFGQVSTAILSAVSASALLAFKTCHWPM
jgi:hypothetical protein